MAIGCEKSVTCQKPIHTRHQKVTIGFGRKTRKIRAVIRMLNASAGLRRSSQCVRDVVGRNWKGSGKMVGKPMEVSPCAVRGR